mmetsp:Transcript_14286/g.34194  ORF Transcript_14286/g.34194 Transcript_14286/m.34194 type:complete len:538 (+) Transcript_14286:115-1728(+)
MTRKRFLRRPMRCRHGFLCAFVTMVSLFPVHTASFLCQSFMPTTSGLTSHKYRHEGKLLMSQFVEDVRPGKSPGMPRSRRDRDLPRPLMSQSAEDVRQGISSGMSRIRRDRERQHLLPRPKLFPGMSLAHNFHEIVLGALVNSNGQDLLSSEDLPLMKKDRRGRRGRRDGTGELRKSRQVAKIERCERIPTWPVSNGLRCRAVARFNPALAAKLEHNIGGADCPNLWLANDDPSATSPFLMLVHHNHSFDLADPARFVEKEILPEGFPSHAHQGMTTVTISLRGGLTHRDSGGTKQVFGAETTRAKENASGPYRGKHTQWLTFGKGIVHELMFDNVRRKGQGTRGSSVIHQELYQIWIDLPNKDRMMEPRVELLGGEESTPVVRRHGTTTTIIAGRHSGMEASVAVTSDLTILRAEMDKFSAWHHDISCNHETMIIYVRTGSIRIGGNDVPAHCTAHLSSEGDVLSVEAGPEGADFLLLSGQPLNQTLLARGSMVSDSRAGLEKAFADYERGEIGTPWPERYRDDEWRSHVARHKER